MNEFIYVNFIVTEVIFEEMHDIKNDAIAIKPLWGKMFKRELKIKQQHNTTMHTYYFNGLCKRVEDLFAVKFEVIVAKIQLWEFDFLI